MRKEGLTFYQLVGHPTRMKILSLASEKPRSATALKEAIGISTGELYHHLKLLEEKELIFKVQIEEEGKKRVGRETRIHTNTEYLRECAEKNKQTFVEDIAWGKKKK